jgi:hypothetical protein
MSTGDCSLSEAELIEICSSQKKNCGTGIKMGRALTVLPYIAETYQWQENTKK